MPWGAIGGALIGGIFGRRAQKRQAGINQAQTRKSHELNLEFQPQYARAQREIDEEAFGSGHERSMAESRHKLQGDMLRDYGIPQYKMTAAAEREHAQLAREDTTKHYSSLGLTPQEMTGVANPSFQAGGDGGGGFTNVESPAEKRAAAAQAQVQGVQMAQLELQGADMLHRHEMDRERLALDKKKTGASVSLDLERAVLAKMQGKSEKTREMILWNDYLKGGIEIDKSEVELKILKNQYKLSSPEMVIFLKALTMAPENIMGTALYLAAKSRGVDLLDPSGNVDAEQVARVITELRGYLGSTAGEIEGGIGMIGRLLGRFTDWTAEQQKRFQEFLHVNRGARYE